MEISRPGKPSIHLTLISRSPRKPRIPGEYAGMSHYSDGIFKPLETNEELRETALTFWRTQKRLAKRHHEDLQESHDHI